MAEKGHSIVCPHCGSTRFLEERVVELNASVVISKGMRMPAQINAAHYQYRCANCQHLLDEHFEHGRLEAH